MRRADHYHDCNQIIFVQKGTVELHVNGVCSVVNAGEIIIISRHENHSISVLSDEYERYVVRISPLIDNDNKEYALLLNRPSWFHNVLDLSCRRGEVTRIFELLLHETLHPEKMSGDMQQLLVRQLLILLYRSCSVPAQVLDSEGFEMVYQIQQQFEKNCNLDYTLESLAKQYCVSVSTLSHRFKDITGYSVFSYLTSCRIASAKHLLARTELSISDIVGRCGFSDNSNFSRTFRQSTGITPSRFRTDHREQTG